MALIRNARAEIRVALIRRRMVPPRGALMERAVRGRAADAAADCSGTLEWLRLVDCICCRALKAISMGDVFFRAGTVLTCAVPPFHGSLGIHKVVSSGVQKIWRNINAVDNRKHSLCESRWRAPIGRALPVDP